MPGMPTARLVERSETSSSTRIPFQTVEIAADATDEAIDVEFRVIRRSYAVGVLVIETCEPEGPWSPDSRVDRYLAPIRRARQQEQLKQLIASQRQKYPPRLLRIWRSVFCRTV